MSWRQTEGRDPSQAKGSETHREDGASLSTFSHLEQQLKSGLAPGLYVLLGDDDFAREAALAAMERSLTGDGDVDRTMVRADEAGVDHIAVAVGSSSLFGDRRLIVVRDVDKLAAAEQERLVPILSGSAPGLVVVVVAKALDGRRQATKALLKAAHVYRFPLPQGPGLVQWTLGHARALGVRLSRPALDTLLALVPPEPQMIHTELEKLALYAGGATVDPTMVQEVASMAVPFAAEHLIFRLTELIVDGRVQEALAALHDLLAVGKVPLVILTMIGRQYRILATALDPDPAAATAHLRQFFKTPPSRTGAVRRRALALGAPAIERALRHVLAADDALKKSQDPRLVLETLVVALAQGK